MVMPCTLYVHRSEWDTFAIRTLDHGLFDRMDRHLISGNLSKKAMFQQLND
jgi:hypothetical protein